MQKQYRTHTCGELTKKEIKKKVILSGWVHSRRDHGGVIFIDLRDRYGLTQVAFDPKRSKKSWQIADSVRSEYVIKVSGVVAARPKDMINKKMKTGEIEVDGNEIEILSKAETLPFEIDDDTFVNEELRLKHRYIDLRRKKMQKNLKLRADIIKFMRDWMCKKDFIEIETPLLTASSPEGARDFLVPSRLHKGKFYALPQAPQQFKQLLMVAGFDKYFQIAPCMRDEDARKDRSPGEFYQLDIEASFMSQDEFLDMIEPLFIDITKKFTKKRLLLDKNNKLIRMDYHTAMETYGSDKPDIRFGFELVDITNLTRKCGFGVFENADMVKGLCVTNGGSKIGRNEIDKTLIPLAKEKGAGGMAWMRMTKDGLESSITKFFDAKTLKELEKTFKCKEGDLLFFIADKQKVVWDALGAIRLYCGQKMDVIDPNEIAFLWVIDFPMYEYDEDAKKLDFLHNPFSMPQGGLKDLQKKDPLDILAYQYDIVCNGIELSSGAVRNHDAELMYKAFEIAGYTKKQVDEKFGHMIKAFSYGAPPHCGFAPGVERLIMVLLDEPNIREVTAFPKNSKAQDLMMQAPAKVDDIQLKELGIKLR